jgi:hypothetical protein
MRSAVMSLLVFPRSSRCLCEHSRGPSGIRDRSTAIRVDSGVKQGRGDRLREQESSDGPPQPCRSDVRCARTPLRDAVAHPSLPNYIALVSESTQGIASHCIRCSIAGRDLADTLQRAGKTWKAYAEGLPAPGFERRRVGWYARKVNPFLYVRDVTSDPRRLARIVPYSQLARDIVARRARRSLQCPANDRAGGGLPYLGKSGAVAPISGIWRSRRTRGAGS